MTNPFYENISITFNNKNDLNKITNNIGLNNKSYKILEIMPSNISLKGDIIGLSYYYYKCNAYRIENYASSFLKIILKNVHYYNKENC